jgi:hypothetical protein
MRESCELAHEGLASKEMGGQPAAQVSQLFRGGPSAAAGGQNVNGWCVALTVCLIWANSSFIAATLLCIAYSFCAFYPWLLAAWAAHNLACTSFSPGPAPREASERTSLLRQPAGPPP